MNLMLMEGLPCESGRACKGQFPLMLTHTHAQTTLLFSLIGTQCWEKKKKSSQYSRAAAAAAVLQTRPPLEVISSILTHFETFL